MLEEILILEPIQIIDNFMKSKSKGFKHSQGQQNSSQRMINDAENLGATSVESKNNVLLH